MLAQAHRNSRRVALALLFAACATAAFAQPPAAPKDDKAEKKDPKAPEETKLQKALKAFQEGKLDDLSKYLKEAVEEDPGLGTPRTILSRWMFQAQKGSEARALLEQAFAETPGHPECYLLNASYALNEGRITDAILSLERVQALASNRAFSAAQRKRYLDESLNGLALAYERRGDWKQVKGYLDDINLNNPGNPQILIRLAKADFLLDQPESAYKNLDAAYAKDPNIDPPELLLAQFWSTRNASGPDQKKIEEEAAKNKEKTEEWFKKAKEKYSAASAMSKPAPAREIAAKVYRGYAEWLMGQGNMPAARAHIEEVAKLEPDSRETLGLQGLFLRYEGNHAEAAKKFEASLAKSPSYAFAMGNLALALSESTNPKDRDRAKEQAEQYQKQNAQNAEGYAVLGYCLLKQEMGKEKPNYAEAEKNIGMAARGGAIAPDTAYYLALLLDKKEKYKEAAELLEKIVEQKQAFVYKADAKKLLDTVKPKVKPDLAPEPKK